MRRRRCVWPPTRCIAQTAPWAPSRAGRRPSWECLRPSRPRPTSWPASFTPCCGTAKSTWTLARNTTNVSISTGRCQRRAAKLGYRLVPIPDGEHQNRGLPLNPAAAAV